MTNLKTPPASPSPAAAAGGASPSPCSIWTPVEEELQALSLGWDDAAFKEKLSRTRAATPPATVFSAMRFPSLLSPNTILQDLPMTDPRPSKGQRIGREIPRRRLFAETASVSTDPMNGPDAPVPQENGVTAASGPAGETPYDKHGVPPLQMEFEDCGFQQSFGDLTAASAMSDSAAVPDDLNMMSLGYSMPQPMSAPLQAGPHGAFSPLALPPNTVLVPAEDPSHPGQPLYRLMTMDPNGNTMNGGLTSQMYTPEVPSSAMMSLGGPMMPAMNGLGFTGMPMEQGMYMPSGMPFPMMGHKIYCLVEFKRGRTVQYEAPHYVAPGEYVIVGGDRGEDLGMVVHSWVSPFPAVDDGIRGNGSGSPMSDGNSPHSSSSSGDRSLQYDNYGNPVPSSDQPIGRVIRRATPKEVQHLHSVQTELEKRCTEFCQQKVLEHGLVLTIVDAEYQFDRKKLTFYYEAAERQDFRDLVRDLYKTYRARIWMSKINTNHR